MTSTFLKIRDLEYVREGYDGKRFILRISRFDIPAGGLVAVVGKSGTGKTTLLNLVSGLTALPQNGGTIHFDLGQGITGRLEAGNTRFPSKKVGRVFQQGHLMASATVAANLAVALEADGKPVSRGPLERALEEAGLAADFLDRRAWQLSGGQAQRVSIARAIVGGHNVIFADEPTSSADPELAHRIIGRFKRWVKGGTAENPRTVFWITHDTELAADFADQILVLTETQDGNDQISMVPEGETRTRGNPGDAATLKNWIGAEILIGNGEDMGGDITFPETKTDRQPLFSKLALGEILSRREAANDFQKVLDLTSVGAQGAPRKMSDCLRLFQPRSLLLRQFLASLLILISVTGVAYQTLKYHQQLTDPRFCNITVSGIDRTASELSPSFVTYLGTRPWPQTNVEPPRLKQITEADYYALLDGETGPPSCQPDIAVWPRWKDDIRVGIPDFGVDEPCRKYERGGTARLTKINVLAAHPNDPIMRALPMIRPARAGSIGEAIAPVEGQPMSFVLGAAAILVRLGLDPQEVAENNESLCVSIHGSDPGLLPFGGVAKELPADIEYSYEGVVPLPAFSTQTGGLSRYSTAAFIFKPWELPEIEAFLLPKNGQPSQFNLDPDSIAKFIDSVELSLTAITVSLVVAALVSVVNMFNLSATYYGFIEQNARAMAMQFAVGVEQNFVRSMLMRHMKLVWLASSLTLILFVLLGTATGWAFGVFAGYMVGPVLIILAITLILNGLVSWAAIRSSTNSWFALIFDKNSEILQSSS